MTASGRETSAAEAYLGRLFDELSGQGVAGRQLLVETEDHLRCAVADLVNAGLSRSAAEATAVARLGDPARLADELRNVTAAPWSATVARLIGTAWILASVAFVSVGLSLAPALAVTAAWGNAAIAGDPPGATYTAARCSYLLEYYPQHDGSCRAASLAHHQEEELRNRMAAGLFGSGGLVALFLVRRGWRGWRRLGPLAQTPPVVVTVAVGATAFGIAAALAISVGVDEFLIGRPWGAWSPIVTGAAFVPACVWFTLRLVVEVRRQPLAAQLPAVAE